MFQYPRSIVRLLFWPVATVAATLLVRARPAADDPVVAPDAKVEKLFEGSVLTEGVAALRLRRMARCTSAISRFRTYRATPRE